MSKPCSICGDKEPFHVHNGKIRIEDYFTIGRGMTQLEAAKWWKQRALDAEVVLRLLQLGCATFDSSTKELRFEGMRYSARDFDWSLLLNTAGRDNVRAALEKAMAA